MLNASAELLTTFCGQRNRFAFRTNPNVISRYVHGFGRNDQLLLSCCQ